MDNLTTPTRPMPRIRPRQADAAPIAADQFRGLWSRDRLGDDPAYRLLLTIPEVCGALAVSRDAVYELLRSGRLPSVTLGRSRRIRVTDLERFVDALPRTAA